MSVDEITPAIDEQKSEISAPLKTTKPLQVFEHLLLDVSASFVHNLKLVTIQMFSTISKGEIELTQKKFLLMGLQRQILNMVGFVKIFRY